ncbi:MAG: class I SAM-dependent methyltransferase [Caldilinea sp.]|nr:class I SAM-dependent methyltransferase [Caldilinea sp.]MDW8442802.1 class I SAM-dependent methyltransferase [Caldilineaceae bacterium]
MNRRHIWSWRNSLVGDLAGAVLEIGVGAGANLPRYRKATCIFAIEPDPKRARQAQAMAMRCPIPVSVKIAVAEALPLASGSVDHVVSSLVFCSVHDQRRALREIRRVLRPGGALHMFEHIRPQTPLLANAAGKITPYWRRIAHNCHLDRSTLETLRAEGWETHVLARCGVFVRIKAWPR